MVVTIVAPVNTRHVGSRTRAPLREAPDGNGNGSTCSLGKRIRGFAEYRSAPAWRSAPRAVHDARRFAGAECTRYDPSPHMRWLVHGNVAAPAILEALRRYEQSAQTVEQVGLKADSSVEEIFTVLRKQQLELLTADAKLAEAPYDEGGGVAVPHDRVIVYLQLEGGEVEQDDAIDRLFERYKRLAPGRLYTVTATRVKVRQLPGPH